MLDPNVMTPTPLFGSITRGIFHRDFVTVEEWGILAMTSEVDRGFGSPPAFSGELGGLAWVVAQREIVIRDDD
jgi:hypothetical protein